MIHKNPGEIKELINSGQYEQALGVQVGASAFQINRAHIKQLGQFKHDISIREQLNKVKCILRDESTLEKANRLLRLSKWDEALGILKTEEQQKDPQAVNLLGYTLHQLGRYKEALPYLTQTAEHRHNATDYLRLGDTQNHLDLLKEAKDSFEKAYSLRGGPEESRLYCNILIKMGLWDQAKLALEQSLARMPQNTELALIQKNIQKSHRRKKISVFLKKTLHNLKHNPGQALNHSAVATVLVFGGSLFATGELIGLPIILFGAAYFMLMTKRK